MRGATLKTRISLSLLVAFVLVATIASAFAKASFRETELRHAHDDSRARVDAIASLVDTRFLALGQDAKAAANDVGAQPVSKVLEQMQRAGFTNALALGKDGEVLGAIGEAQANGSLRARMANAAPASNYLGTVYRYEEGWLMVATRSTDSKSAVVGAMSRSYLSDSFLVDALIHPEYAHALVLSTGEVMAATANFEELRHEPITTRGQKQGIALHAHVEGRVPLELVDARVSEMTTRFLLSMAVAFGVGGGVTILLVAYAFRPLDRITEGARRLGRGEEDLGLIVREKDELGQLAEILNQSAAALAEARRTQALRAQEARLAAEDFELAVGDLSRSVGEADTPQEVAARLAEGLLRVTTTRAVIVRHESELLAIASRDDADAAAYHALYATDPRAWQRTRVRDGELEVALLPYDGTGLPPAETRKVDILGAQAAIAIHRARAAVELRNAKSQKEMFLDILSHDLKNPLAVARGRVELLARKHPEAAQKFGQVEQALDRATRILEEAVLLSKLERGDRIQMQPIDLAALFEESVESLRPLAAPRGITITMDAPPSATWPADPLLQRAVENLLSNAIKWSPVGGSVEVRIVPGERACEVRVVDHGPGIPDADKPRVFARFERADRTGVKGTGLGLAIAQRVTQMHGGSIRIEDTPGGGATFVLEIPHTIIAPEARA